LNDITLSSAGAALVTDSPPLKKDNATSRATVLLKWRFKTEGRKNTRGFNILQIVLLISVASASSCSKNVRTALDSDG
jgi:hypothetical protein